MCSEETIGQTNQKVPHHLNNDELTLQLTTGKNATTKELVLIGRNSGNTLYAQLLILYGEISKERRGRFKLTISNTLLEDMKKLVQAVPKRGLKLHSKECEQAACNIINNTNHQSTVLEFQFMQKLA